MIFKCLITWFKTKFYLGTSTSKPAFKDTPCPEDEDLLGDFPETPDLCVEVLLPNLDKDMLILSLVPGTSIYEGYLRNEMDVPVILIDVPSTKKRMVSMGIYFYINGINM